MTMKRYNGWELAPQEDGPLVRYEDAQAAITDAYRRGFAAGKDIAARLCDERSKVRPEDSFMIRDWVDGHLNAANALREQIKAIPDPKEAP